MRRLRILIWHIHGTYLNCLVQAPHDFYLPVKPGRPEGYGGRGPTFTWPDNAIEVPAEEVRRLPLDLVISQTPKNYFVDREEILSPAQRRLPQIYIEHNPPREHPTNTRHPIDDPNVLLVHVCHFNNIMWDSGRCRTKVILHGVKDRPDALYIGDLARGVVVVNGIQRRARIAGFDIFERMRERLPLDLIGMESEALGGLGDIPSNKLPYVERRYRFFFNPIRYTSFPMAVVEAMMLGMPVVALSTTELPEVVDQGVTGFVSNDLAFLEDRMQMLLADRAEAARIGRNARDLALARYSIERFIRDWEDAFRLVTS